MAFNTNSPRLEFTATSGQTEFDFNFKIFNTSDIIAYQTPAGEVPSDTEDILVETTDYTVSIDGDDGGTVTLVSGATLNDKITLIRRLPCTRDIDYQQNGDLFAETVDLDQDYQTYLIQQHESLKGRFVQLPNSVQGVDTSLPAPEASTYIRWNSAADGLENDTSIPEAVTISAENAAAAAASEAAAAASEAASALSETNAAASAASIDPSNLLHTIGYGGSDPEGYTSTESDNTFAKLSGATFTGRVIGAAGSSNGFAFPDDAYGGDGDRAAITLQQISGEETQLTIEVADNDTDLINLITPSATGLKHNGQTVWSNANSGLVAYGNGYTVLGNGLIIQWGNNNTNQTVTFPTAFPNALLAFSIGQRSDTGNYENVTFQSITASNFFFKVGGTSAVLTASWIAIGH